MRFSFSFISVYNVYLYFIITTIDIKRQCQQALSFTLYKHGMLKKKYFRLKFYEHDAYEQSLKKLSYQDIYPLVFMATRPFIIVYYRNSSLAQFNINILSTNFIFNSNIVLDSALIHILFYRIVYFFKHKLKIKYLPVRNRLFKVQWCMQNPDNLTEFYIDIQRQNTLFNILNK